MAKPSVTEMLKRPVRTYQAEPQNSGIGSMLEAELKDMAMERIHDKAKASALEELKPKIDAAEEKAATAEAALESAKSDLSAAQAKIASLSAANAAEVSAREAASHEYEEECEKVRTLEVQASQMTGRMAELEKHNASLQASIKALTAEISKKPVVQKQATPSFEFTVTARDKNGAIQSLSAKPK